MRRPGRRRRYGLGLFLPTLSLAWGGCAPPESRESTTSGPGPESLIEAWVAMWNSYDLDQVGELFLADERLSYFSSEREGVIRGYEAVVEHHRGFGFVPGGAETGSRLWLEEVGVERFRGMAVVTAIWYFQGGGEGERQPASPPQRGPVTFVCVLEEGRWWFVHMNFSAYLPPQ